MKRLTAILAVAVLCFTLTIPVFAVDADSITLPESDASFTFIAETSGITMAFVVPNGYKVPFSTGFNSDNSPIFHFDMVKWYSLDSKGEWNLITSSSPHDSDISLSGAHILYCSHTLYDPDGNVYVSSTVPETEIEVSNNALSSVVTADSLTGILGEVLGLLIIAFPVLVGLFGIRKGISFLFARIRGV